ncbi:MAG: hypothetical protein IT198_06355 [Acidimicrobiia bacterium]|nr:hypothetical protein [Acidimicrobiia bacterium]
MTETEAGADPSTPVAQIVVDVRPITEPLDYLLNEGVPDLEIGSLVRVPLQGRRVRGWVVAFRTVADVPPDVRPRLRPVASKVTEIRVADAETIRLAEWSAARYAGPEATILAWGTPRPLPHVRRPPPGTPDVEPRSIPAVTDAIAASRSVEAFVRTWPGDDAAGTIAPLTAALPPGRCGLVITPPAFAPRVPGAVELFAETDTERTRAWETAVSGAARLVVAGRHGPLVPIPNLGFVAVCQSHMPWHKDERTPALDARVIARARAELAAVPFVEIGPTSPVGPEGIRAALAVEGRSPVELTVPHAAGRWPVVEVTDLTAEPTVGALGSRFFQAVRSVLDRDGSVLVFLNRRGIARSLVCRACGRMAGCTACGGLLRPSDTEMACVRCGTRLPFVACPACGADRVRLLGIGVTKLRTELAAAFGTVQVVEAAGEGAASVAAATPLPGGIVVATQVAVRHRRRFDLVVLVDPDSALSRPGIRGEESAFHVLVDAVGTAKGTPQGGHVLVQTRRPDHPAIRALATHTCAEYEGLLLSEREVTGLPPWRRAVEVHCADPEVLTDIAAALAACRAEVFGPRLEGRPGLLGLCDVTSWAETVTAVRGVVAAHPDVKIRVEVDPLDPL